MRRNWFHFSAGHPLLVLAPTHLRVAVGNGNHGDAVIHGTNQGTQVAPYAFEFLDFRNRLARNPARTKPMTVRVNKSDGLMSSVFTRNVTQVAPDALIIVNAGDTLVIKVRVSHFWTVGTAFPTRSITLL